MLWSLEPFKPQVLFKGVESKISMTLAGARCEIQNKVRRCNQKFPDWVDKEIYAYNNKHSLRNNIKGYGGKSH